MPAESKFHSFFVSAKHKLRPPRNHLSIPTHPVSDRSPKDRHSPQPPDHEFPKSPQALDYDTRDRASQSTEDRGRSISSKEFIPEHLALLDFTRLPKRVTKDKDMMHRFSMAASHRAQLSVAKHNAEVGVRDCEQQLQVRHRQLHDVIAGLRVADRALDELWQSVFNEADNVHTMPCDDAGSTDSNSSGLS